MNTHIEQTIRESINEGNPIDVGRESCPFYSPINLGCNSKIFSTCSLIIGEEYHSCMLYQDSIGDLN